LSITHKKIQAQKITDQSWIVSEFGNRIGLLSLTGTSVKLITPQGHKEYTDLDDLLKAHKWYLDYVEHKEKEEQPHQNILHLPVKHQELFNVEHAPLISYCKQANSSVRFAAGYWGLRFSHAWTAAFCPKLVTLSEYDHVGPFSTKLELNTILAQKNRDSNRS
jgi:hypothetical protein